MPVFDDVKYHLPLCLSAQRRSELSSVLDINGARPISLARATHIITNSTQFEGWQSISEGVHIVSDKWVDRSIIMGKSQPEQYFSADPAMIFSGIVACATDLPSSDLEVLSAGITALGGQWRVGLTRDVTHLFALSTDTDKYNTATHFKDQTKMIILTPHWFDDAVRLGIGSLPTTEYEWPDPKILQPSSEVTNESDAAKRTRKVSTEKQLLYRTATMTPGQNGPSTSPSRDVWQKKRILLSRTLELAGSRREAVKAGIRRANGLIVEFEAADGDGNDEEEFRKVDEVDIFITRYRSGAAYFKAARAGKTIGTLSWLFHVESSGTVSRPSDQLLHYPIPKRRIEGFSSHEITITNYTGESRDYLKKLISAMGAKFTPSMSTSNTVVIAACISGNKTTKARSWSIPVVNHTWLEDCFIQWRNLTVGIEKYIVFPPGVDFSQVLGERGVGRVVLEDIDFDMEEELEREAAAKMNASAKLPREGKDDSSRSRVHAQSAGKEASVGDAREVDEAVALREDEGDILTKSQPGGGSQKKLKRRNSRVDEDNGDAQPAEEVRASKTRVEEDTMDIDEGARPPSPKPRAWKPRVSATKRNAAAPVEDTAEEPQQDNVGDDVPARRKLVRKISQQRSCDPASDGESDDEPGPSKVKQKDGSSDSSDIHFVGSKLKRGALRRMETDEELTDLDTEPQASSPSKGKSRAAKSPQKISTRTLSVLVPPLPKTYATPKTSASVGRKESFRVAADAAVGSSSKRGRPSTSSKLSTAQTPRRPEGETGAPSMLGRTSSKRSAASKASTRLQNEIMPDVISFERERKNAKSKNKDKAAGEKRKKSGSDASALALSSDGEDVQSNKRQRLDAGGTKSKQRRGEDEGGESSTTPKSAKKTKAAAQAEDEDGPEVNKKATTQSKRSKQSEAEGKSTGSDAKVVRVMTTQLALSDDVLKRLVKLGAKITTRANECTHLIAKNIVRTEKFLCALAVSPFILSEKWATASAAANQLLPEDKYMLSDPDVEKKWDFNLAESLRRSKEHGRSLFKQVTFYVTPKVPIDQKLLKNVVAAGGGQISSQSPTSRILKGKEGRYVISCPEDASIWRTLARDGFPIYSTELILTGVLRQKIDWEDNENKVQGTC